MNESWIKLYRKFREWGWYKDGNTVRVWLEILLTANYEDKEWMGILVRRGQLITSVKHLSKNLDISTKSVRTSLNHLKSTNEVAINTTTHYTLITVNKFSEYQEVASQVANNGQTSGKQVATTKEYKNIKKRTTTTEQAKNYLQKWNEVFSTAYVSTKAIEGNLAYWLDSYKLEEILEAIGGIKKDKYWKDKDLAPEWLLRQKDKGEPVDRIGRMRENLKEDFSLGLNFNNLTKK